MRSDTLLVVTNFSLHGVYCETFDVALRICVKPLGIREDLGPWSSLFPSVARECEVVVVNLI